ISSCFDQNPPLFVPIHFILDNFSTLLLTSLTTLCTIRQTCTMTPFDTQNKMGSVSIHNSNNAAPSSYFDIAKPISIPNSVPGRINTDICNMIPYQDMDENTLPEYLQSFQDAGISDTRLRQFTWLHPKNYGSEGSLSDDFILSPYGTSVSSPRGDEWEIVDHGPRKSIDELWDEVFEYKERIKLLERASQEAQEHTLKTQLDACNDYIVKDDEGVDVACGQTPNIPSVTSAGIGNGSKIITQVDKTAVYACRKDLRTEHGGATRSLLQLALINCSSPLERS
ncbi:MAG: hypothetical protein J3R72DRAFT_135856, partial [Linnemannia gamsii]